MTRNFICYPSSKQNSPEPFDSGEFQKENDALALHILVGLEGSADGVVGGGCVGGAYGDLTGGATGLPVVVSAVLHVADHTLDVVTALLIVHFHTVLLDYLADTAGYFHDIERP